MSNGNEGAPARVLVFEDTPALARQLRSAFARREQPADVVECEKLSELGGILSGPEPFDVLVAGRPLANHAGLQGLRLIRDEVPAMSVVLALGDTPDAPLSEIVGAGALDLLALPIDDERLMEGVDRAIAHRRALVLPSVVPADAEPESTETLARVFTIASASGGCGKTFFATNLAWFLNKYVGGTTCIIDLDLQFGEVTSALRLRPRYTIADLLHQGDEGEQDLADLIAEFTETHESGIKVLAAPREPADADSITAADVGRVIDAARVCFDHVIIDTPPALADTVLLAFDRSNELYVMATLDVPSVRNLSVFLGTLDRLKVPPDDIRLILNKAERDVGVDVSQVLKLFPQGFDSTLPYDREVSRSINSGSPVLAASPGAPVSRLLLSGLARHLAPEQAEALTAAPARSSFFRRKQS